MENDDHDDKRKTFGEHGCVSFRYEKVISGQGIAAG